jgi:hypothetical protein
MKTLKTLGIAVLLFLGIVGIITMILGIGYCFWALFGENAIVCAFGFIVFLACLFYAYVIVNS